MANNTESAKEGTAETFRVGVRVPSFNPDDPTLWFAQIEGQFMLSNIVRDETKYYYVLAQLETQYSSEVRDIIINPPETGKYAKLREELIKRLSASQEKKTKQLLMHEELGDRKPSQFLRHLQQLAGPNVPTDFIRTIWANRLPTNLQTVLASQVKMSLEDLAELADRINDIVPTANQVASTSAASAAVTSTSDSDLKMQVAELTRKVEAMSTELFRRSRRDSGGRGSYRNRSRSRSRSRSQDHPHCWYHYTFRERARKCIQPCSYKSENNQGSRQ